MKHYVRLFFSSQLFCFQLNSWKVFLSQHPSGGAVVICMNYMFFVPLGAPILALSLVAHPVQDTYILVVRKQALRKSG